MPEIAAAPALLLFEGGGDDDDGFGEFKFVSSFSSPPSLSSNLSSIPPANHLQEDEEWGDFVATPVGSNDPIPDGAVRNPDLMRASSWEKPKGALALSLFGDEEVEEPEPALEAQAVFGNHGFSDSGVGASKGSANGGIESGSGGGGLKDLIASLYGQPGNHGNVAPSDDGDEDFDESGWEFKNAMDAEVKKEENGLEISRREMLADGHETQGASLPLQVSNYKPIQSNLFPASDGLTNGLASNSDPQNHYCSDASQKDYYVGNENGFYPTLENGVTIPDENGWEFQDAFSENQVIAENGFHPSLQNGAAIPHENGWDFKDAFSENKVSAGCLEPQNILDSEVKELTPANELQGSMSIRENNDFPSTCTSRKQCPDGQTGDRNGLSWNPTSAGSEIKNFNNNSGVVLSDIICSLYDSAGKINPPQRTSENGLQSSEDGSNSTTDGAGFDVNHWELETSSKKLSIDQHASSIKDRSQLTEPTQGSLIELYSRLKDDSLYLAVQHLDNLKKAHEAVAISGEEAEALELGEEIQAARSKLGDMISDVNKGKYLSKHVCVSNLLQDVQEPRFRLFEREYRLVERILSAEDDLKAAISLFEHSTLVLKVLGLASRDDQYAYVMAWCQMLKASSQELEHGTMIWVEALCANVTSQILSQGTRYFIALGEIYRVAEILRASLKLYKPWILSNEVVSQEISASLEKCAEAWTTSGLGKALDGIVSSMDLDSADIAKMLLESIRLKQGFDEHVLINENFGDEVCALSLLHIGVLQDMKAVVWNGELYCLKLANLWANRISCDPPRLPHIHVRYFEIEAKV